LYAINSVELSQQNELYITKNNTFVIILLLLIFACVDNL